MLELIPPVLEIVTIILRDVRNVLEFCTIYIAGSTTTVYGTTTQV